MTISTSRLKGTRVVVTGVGTGLGRATVEVLAAHGAAVLGCGLDEEAGRETMSGVGPYTRVDVSQESEVAALVSLAQERLGGIDAMVNNAATQIERELTETTEAELDMILGVNLKGVFFGCKHAIAAMLAGGGGSIVNVASILSLVGDGALPAYGAAKAGVLGLTRAAAVHYGSRGIRCNAVSPGDMDTPLNQRWFAAAEDPAAFRADVEAAYPLRRIAQPAEVAAVVAFLVSEDASFVNGENIVVDGGLLAGAPSGSPL